MATLGPRGWSIARLVHQWGRSPQNLESCRILLCRPLPSHPSLEGAGSDRFHSQSQSATSPSPSCLRAADGAQEGELAADPRGGPGGETAASATAGRLEITADDIEVRRRAYLEQVSVVRKKYAAELAEKERQSARAVKQAVEEQRAQKATKLEARKERSVVRQQEARAQQAAFQERKRLELKLRAERKQARDEIQQGRVAFQQEKLRDMSAQWIEEAELEDRILKAAASQYHL